MVRLDLKIVCRHGGFFTEKNKNCRQLVFVLPKIKTISKISLVNISEIDVIRQKLRMRIFVRKPRCRRHFLFFTGISAVSQHQLPKRMGDKRAPNPPRSEPTPNGPNPDPPSLQPTKNQP